MENSFALVAGLGNPGTEYAETRHNIGFMVTARLLDILSGNFEESRVCSGVCWKGRLGGRTLYVLNPMTFMNLSGKSIAALGRVAGVSVKEMILVYDDVDLPLGRLRFARGGGSAGHRGVESAISELGEASFARLRVGIDSVHRDSQVDFVLSPFAGDEKDLLEKVVDKAAEALKLALHRGLTVAMNAWNGIDMRVDEKTTEING